MNETAARIIKQLEARQRLLCSLNPSGLLVAFDPVTALFHGYVDDAMALVPVEHASTATFSDVARMRQRGLQEFIDGAKLVPMADAVADALLDIEALLAWVKECG